MSVARVERLADGRRRVHLVTADEAARACPACGVFATQVKGSAVTRPRDLPYGESGLEFRWHKRRWWCREAGCLRRSFTEQIPQIPAGARLTARLRGAAGRRIRDAGSTVIQAARDLHLSWPTVMEAFRTQARDGRYGSRRGRWPTCRSARCPITCQALLPATCDEGAQHRCLKTEVGFRRRPGLARHYQPGLEKGHRPHRHPRG
ncbi:helix-turn-helix domain-containing protein [Streptomyces sp. NPDC048473]|uniref:helix-turn-helix domain-containing protein n=1 Tax=unclassified Streptomyces TaxID=2593676 RepID=UPI0037147AEF